MISPTSATMAPANTTTPTQNANAGMPADNRAVLPAVARRRCSSVTNAA
jgi:hypothetical protein